MSQGWVVVIAIALGADAFSLALAIGLTGISKRMIFRLSMLVALFHVLMPLAGLVAGQTLGLFLGRVAKGAGALILFWLGARMLYPVLRPKTEHWPLSRGMGAEKERKLPAGISLEGAGLFALAASVSVDALSVGFSLGTMGGAVGRTVIIIGCAAGFMTFAGLVLGRLLGTWAGEKAEFFGGLALVLIGLKIALALPKV
ncbi:putative manganese efflux pump MntP [Peptococcaceae bacterium CEB3]|nr:putative manganese efflux pump MntP [Peptococcaceae bacterium CEB3]